MSTPLRDQLQTTLGATFTLDRELGGGGMSRVFVARDKALGRDVVVKVLAPDLTEGLSAERFAREVRLAARLQHPNIVPVLSAGAADGVPYFVMPYVDGDSLRARLREGTLSLGEVVSILRDVAKALAYAHRRGVVHRDVKPENILLADGTAVVTDFGVAKAIAAAKRDDGPEGSGPRDLATRALTRLGMAVGTPAYMAPEQAAGDPNVDQRADVYAWGVLAYELLAGRHPFAERRTAQALVVAHLTEHPTPLEAVAAGVPPGLAALVMRCLAKDPADRPADAALLLSLLETTAGAGEMTTPRERTPLPTTAAPAAGALPAVGVLPFANLSSDPENEYLSDGITDEIIGTLGRMRGVRVAGRASCFALKGQALDPRVVGERLKVTAVVEGSVRRAGNRIRVQAELVNAADGYQLWADRLDRELTDIFAVQEEIAQAIAGSLSERLTSAGGAEDARRHVAGNPEAYRLYLQAVHALRTQSTPASYARVLTLLARARELDPSLARVQMATAVANSNLAVFSLRPAHEVMPSAREAARTAIALDPTLGEAHAMLAQVTYAYDWQWAEAEAGFARALEFGPNETGAVSRAALFHAVASRGAAHHEDEAARLVAHACELEPLSAWVRFVGGTVLWLMRRNHDALAVTREAVELDPHHGLATMVHAGVLRDLGKIDEALPVMNRALELTGSNPLNLLNALVLDVKAGDMRSAGSKFDALVERAATGYVAPLYLAQGYGWLGRIDEAFEWLERAVAARDFWLMNLGIDPLSDPLRDDPRFALVVRRTGAPGA